MNNEVNMKDLITTKQININDNIYQYIQEIKKFILINFPEIHISSRCLKQIVSISRSLAMINEKDYVTIQDIKDVIPYVLKHRINIIEKKNVTNFIKEEILDKINLPNDK
jgi:MoxR-like ATPase